MNIREINKPVTAASLNESLAKRFGQKIALEKFTLEQLQDVRNKVRTTLSQVETNESFDTVQSEAYQKNKLFLDVLNAEITEREDVAEAAKPDYIDIDGDGDKKEPMKKAAKDAKKKKKVKEGDGIYHDCAKKFEHKVYGECTVIPGEHTLLEDGTVTHYDATFEKDGQQYVVRNVSVEDMYNVISEGHTHASKKTRKKKIKEGAEDQAELVMAAKNMVDRVTSWMEDTAEMQTESMLELADAIRDEKGQQESDAFVDTVKPALESLYGAMETTRQALTQGVGQLTGEAEPVTDMGAEPEADLEPEMEPTVDAEEGGEDFGAADAAAGGEEEAGREKRESIQRKREMLESSRRLGTILSKKK